MQVSKRDTVARSCLSAVKMLFVVSSCAFILMWMNHSSINLYWQQKYHTPSPIEGWDRYAYWAQGSKLTSALTAAKATFVEKLTSEHDDDPTALLEEALREEMALYEAIQDEIALSDLPQVKTHNPAPDEITQNKQPTPSLESVLLLSSCSQANSKAHKLALFSPASLQIPPKLQLTQEITGAVRPVIAEIQSVDIPTPPSMSESNSEMQSSAEAMLPEEENAELASPYIAPTISLQAGDEVFFVGDSLMQGIAPHMINTLRKDHQIHSINLSKQSTGLAYPSFFNWPKTVQTTLEKNQNIRLMVIFMGPNDPWDMPDKHGKPYLHFKSAEWESAYRSRVDAILEMAKQSNVQVIWIEAPNMRKKSLSSAMRYLSQIYQQETEKFRQLYVTTNDILGCEGDEYTNYIKLENNKHVKVRTDDGIHFSLIGQRRIADKILSLIQVKAQDDDAHNT